MSYNLKLLRDLRRNDALQVFQFFIVVKMRMGTPSYSRVGAETIHSLVLLFISLITLYHF